MNILYEIKTLRIHTNTQEPNCLIIIPTTTKPPIAGVRAASVETIKTISVTNTTSLSKVTKQISASAVMMS